MPTREMGQGDAGSNKKTCSIGIKGVRACREEAREHNPSKQPRACPGKENIHQPQRPLKNPVEAPVLLEDQRGEEEFFLNKGEGPEIHSLTLVSRETTSEGTLNGKGKRS